MIATPSGRLDASETSGMMPTVAVTFSGPGRTLGGAIGPSARAGAIDEVAAMRLLKPMTISALALGLSVVAIPAARAAMELPFSQPAFDASRHDGKPILVHIVAPWCPYCAKQNPILAELGREPAFEDLVIYDVDFDSQKDIVRALGAQKQSTMIAFHGASERGRSTGVTDEHSIKDLLDKTKN